MPTPTDLPTRLRNSGALEPPGFSSLDEGGRPVCELCGTALRKARVSAFWRFNLEVVQPYGWRGNSIFCSEAHAAEWGVIKASSLADKGRV